MSPIPAQPISASQLRRDLSARNLTRATQHEHELSYGAIPSVIYCESEQGTHGNFLPASYRRICADPEWAVRLLKTYTASARVPRSADRRRAELDCAASSDALLMNVFCYPGMLRRAGVCALLGVEPGLRPRFGVRARIPMRKGETDRTELDMLLGPLIVEAKLTEGSFGHASRERVMRYINVAEVFDLEALPWGTRGLAGYQLVRNVLAAHFEAATFLLLTDGRRTDLREIWFRILQAVRSCELRSRLTMLTWQELAAAAPPTVKKFLAMKYGVEPAMAETGARGASKNGYTGCAFPCDFRRS